MRRPSISVDAAEPEVKSGAVAALDVSIWDQSEAVRTAASGELPQQVLAPAVARIGRIGLAALLVLGLQLAGLLLLGPDVRSAGVPALLLAMLLSLGLFGLTRVKALRLQAVTNFGSVYLILLCLLLAAIRHSAAAELSEPFRFVSPVVLPILAFAALVPAPPQKTLFISLLAAAMDPLALFLARARFEPSGLPWMLLSPVASAFVSREISAVVYRLSEGIARAKRVGSYRLISRLGVGGMAEVWRAEHRLLARPAAIKLIRPRVLLEHGPVESERLLRLFTREAQATAALSSPHTIALFDFGVTREGSFYYVMELLKGLDLQSLVERFGPQPSERASHLLWQAAHSLREAHNRSFVHRDVKPANIFVCALGGEVDFVKVLDFGLVLDRHPTAEELEDGNRFVGTPSVMAPEMLRFQAPVDARADIYALGCVGYWLLAGRRVFESETRSDMLVMHAHQRPLAPSRQVEVLVHPGLERLVMSCLEKNPNKRPQTAQEVMDALSRLVFDAPWTEERRMLWWRSHLPKAEPSEAPMQGPAAATEGPARP